MVKCYMWPIGICSWSVSDSVSKLAKIKQKLGIEHLHLNLAPILEGDKGLLDLMGDYNFMVTSTMINFPQEDYSSLSSIKLTGGIVPDRFWPINRQRVLDAIRLTAEMKVRYLSFHFGFIDTRSKKFIDKFSNRVNLLADAAAKRRVMLLMETGQETPEELRQFLEYLNRPSVGVNFDPANIVLYNVGNPIKAVEILKPWIKHVHIKDAIKTKKHGTWGKTVVWGNGQIGVDNFLLSLKRIGFTGALAIETGTNNSFKDVSLTLNRLAEFSIKVKYKAEKQTNFYSYRSNKI